MRSHQRMSTLGLLAVLILAACAPAQGEPAVVDTPAQQATATQVPAAAETAPAATLEQQAVAPTEAVAEAPQAAPTSRGPNLESTPPSSVELASGELQLVEFFRYT